LNERGIFAIIKERKENSNGHYNYNVSDELRGLCEPSWNPPSFKNAADAKAWLDEVLKKTPLTKKERKDLEEASEQDVNARMAPDPVMKTYKNGDERNIRKTMSRNDTNAATTTTNRTHLTLERKMEKFAVELLKIKGKICKPRSRGRCKEQTRLRSKHFTTSREVASPVSVRTRYLRNALFLHWTL
jgi:hypothetical protein